MKFSRKIKKKTVQRCQDPIKLCKKKVHKNRDNLVTVYGLFLS